MQLSQQLQSKSYPRPAGFPLPALNTEQNPMYRSLMLALASLILSIHAGWLSGSNGTVSAQSDPQIVGILSTAVLPETAKQLELTEQQLEQLSVIIKDREAKGLALGQTVRELPPSERDAQTRQFVRESERAGFSVLNAQQKSVLQQMRLAKLGMMSLLDVEVSETVGLSEGQIKQLQEIADSRAEIIREVGRAKVYEEMNTRMKAVLTVGQYTTWQAMAGISNRNKGEGRTEVASTDALVAPPQTTDIASDENATALNAEKTAESMPAEALASTSENATQLEAAPMDPPETALVEPAISRDLLINFKETPWESVLKWICEQADLTLMTNTYPTGSFTYTDKYRKYSVAEAMDVMNGVLLRDGYSLIRKGRGLMVLDLGETSPDKADMVRQYVREMSQLVSAEDLDQRGEFELCKCLFFLGRLSADDAKEVVEDLLGPQGSVLAFEPAAQILVTETGGKLRLIRSMLRRIEDPTSSPGSKVVALSLKHVTAEEVLSVARPLLSLQEGVNTSADVNLSTDTFGNTIFATGKADKLQTLKDVAEKVDIDPGINNNISGSGEKAVLRSHAVRGSDPETTFDIIQTMLAGVPSVRVTRDPQTNNIIAFCLPSDHDLIQRTLDEIAGRKANFNVISLRRIDPQAAILTLEKMFGKKTGADKDAKGPIFYGDTTARTLMVQGTDDEVRVVQEIIAKLEESGPQSSPFGDRFGFVPVSGKSADRLLDSLGLMWNQNQAKNPIKVYSTKSYESKTDRRTRPSERELEERSKKRSEREKEATNPSSEEKKASAKEEGSASRSKPASEAGDQPAGDEKVVPATAKPAETTSTRANIRVGDKVANPLGFLNTLQQAGQMATGQLLMWCMVAQPPKSDPPETAEDDAKVGDALNQQVPAGQEPIMVIPGANSKSDIVIYRSPTGLIVTSDDKAALAEFQEMARMLTDQLALGSSEPAVIYLRHIRAQAAEELLKGILSGESSSGGGGGLLGNVVGELGGGLIGGLLGGGRSSSPASSSTPQGGIAQNEYSIMADPRLNALIVKASPMDMDLIEKLIDVIDQEDSPVDIETRGIPRIIQLENGDAETVAGLVREAFKDRIAGNDSASNRQPSPQEFLQALRGGGGGGGRNGSQSQLKESTMTIAADKNTNSLIVTSTLQLYEQVYDLVEQLDAASAENETIVESVLLPGNVNPTVIQNALQSTFGAAVRSSQLPQQQQQNNQRNQQQGGNRGQQGMGMQFPGMQGMGFQIPQGGNRGAQGFQGLQGGGGNQRNFQGFGGQGFGGQGFGGQGFGGQGTGNRNGTNQSRGTGNTQRGGNQRGR